MVNITDIYMVNDGYSDNLVGGAITILKNMSLSMGTMTSHIWNGKMFETTDQVSYE